MLQYRWVSFFSSVILLGETCKYFCSFPCMRKEARSALQTVLGGVNYENRLGDDDFPLSPHLNLSSSSGRNSYLRFLHHVKTIASSSNRFVIRSVHVSNLHMITIYKFVPHGGNFARLIAHHHLTAGSIRSSLCHIPCLLDIYLSPAC